MTVSLLHPWLPDSNEELPIEPRPPFSGPSPDACQLISLPGKPLGHSRGLLASELQVFVFWLGLSLLLPGMYLGFADAMEKKGWAMWRRLERIEKHLVDHQNEEVRRELGGDWDLFWFEMYGSPLGREIRPRLQIYRDLLNIREGKRGEEYASKYASHHSLNIWLEAENAIRKGNLGRAQEMYEAMIHSHSRYHYMSEEVVFSSLLCSVQYLEKVGRKTEAVLLASTMFLKLSPFYQRNFGPWGRRLADYCRNNRHLLPAEAR